MAEKPSMRICGVYHVEVTPDERTVWRCERNLWILALCVELVVGAGDGKPNEREQGKEHGGGTSLWGSVMYPVIIPKLFVSQS